MVIRFCGPFWDSGERSFLKSGEEPRYLPDWTVHDDSTAYAVPNVMPWVMHKKGRGRDQCAARLAGLMRELTPEQWPTLYASFACAEVRPQDVKVLAALAPDDAVEMLGVATLNRDGYVREPAVRAIAQLQHSRAIPYLLLRLGDWVEPVRLAATEALRMLMTPGNAPVFLEHHRLLQHLSAIRRVNLTDIRREIADYLSSEPVRPVLMQQLRSEQPSVRLFRYQILAESGELRKASVQAAAQDPSPAIRRWIAGRVARGEQPAPDDLRRALIRDRSAFVSTTMVRWLSEDDVRRFRDDLTELAFANARTIRRAARFKLRGEAIDFAALARERLIASGGAVAPGVVATLADTGDASDLPALRDFLDHPRSAVRAAAMAGLARLDPEGALPSALARLDDTSGRVRREAIEAIRALPQHLWLDSVRQALASGPARAQAAALRLLSQLVGWESLAAAMQAVVSEHQSVRRRGEAAMLAWSLRRWNWMGVGPSPDLSRRISELWPRVRSLPSLQHGEGAWTDLRSWLKTLEAPQ